VKHVAASESAAGYAAGAVAAAVPGALAPSSRAVAACDSYSWQEETVG
jgi:hypothetical protein